MKIIDTRPLPRSCGQPTIKDVKIGGVFMSETVWPGQVFMRIWSDNAHVKFVDISDECSGSTYSTSFISIENDPFRYEAKILEGVTLCIE